MKKIALFLFALSAAASYSAYASVDDPYPTSQEECCEQKYIQCQMAGTQETTCRRNWVQCLSADSCEL